MTEIRKDITRTPVTVSELTVGKFQKANTITAMLRQEVTTVSHYPSAVHRSDMQQNIFGQNEFNDDEQSFTSTEKRVAFIDVPEGTTEEQVTAKLTPQCTLYRVLSNTPILTDNHKNAISRGVITLDDIADSQIARYGDGHEKAGQLILDPSGKVQYRKVFFWTTTKADIDQRGMEAHPEYMTDAVAQELGLNSNITTGVVLENQQEVM